ncbi:hypothetical protein ACWD7C_19545 [Streptomyces sp. NPDC005134]
MTRGTTPANLPNEVNVGHYTQHTSRALIKDTQTSATNQGPEPYPP